VLLHVKPDWISGCILRKSCDGILEILPAKFKAGGILMGTYVKGPFGKNGIKIRLTRLS
jgi:hypothetical protein